MSPYSCARSLTRSLAFGALALLSFTSCGGGGGSGGADDEQPGGGTFQPSGTLMLMGDDVPMVPDTISIGDLAIIDQMGFATQYFFVDEDSVLVQDTYGSGEFGEGDWIPGDVNNLFTLTCTEVVDGMIDDISFTIVVGGVGYIYRCSENGNPSDACGMIMVDDQLGRMEFDNVTLHADSGDATGDLLVNGVLVW